MNGKVEVSIYPHNRMINTTVFNPFPILENNSIRLRRITMDDASDLFAIRSDINVVKYLGRDRNKDISETIDNINLVEDMINREEGIRWGITLKPSNKIIGSIGFWRLIKPHSRAEIGYDLHPDYWNQGIMSQALELTLDFAFKNMNIHSVEANTDKDNIASQMILTKNRFIKEAHFKENYFYNGIFIDSVIFSCINPHH